MLSRMTITERIVDELGREPECELEALVGRMTPFSWQEVFLEVDRLSRTGQIRMTKRGGTAGIRLRLAASELS